MESEDFDLNLIGIGESNICELIQNPRRINVINTFGPQTLVLQIDGNDINEQTILQEMLTRSSHIFDGYNVRTYLNINNLLLEELRGMKRTNLFGLNWPFPQDMG